MRTQQRLRRAAVLVAAIAGLAAAQARAEGGLPGALRTIPDASPAASQPAGRPAASMAGERAEAGGAIFNPLVRRPAVGDTREAALADARQTEPDEAGTGPTLSMTLAVLAFAFVVMAAVIVFALTRA